MVNWTEFYWETQLGDNITTRHSFSYSLFFISYQCFKHFYYYWLQRRQSWERASCFSFWQSTLTRFWYLEQNVGLPPPPTSHIHVWFYFVSDKINSFLNNIILFIIIGILQTNIFIWCLEIRAITHINHCQQWYSN